MNETLILGGIIIVAWVGLLLLRVPSSIAFLSLLIGQLVSSETGSDVYARIGSTLRVNNNHYVQVALLILPLAVTILLLRGRVAKHKLAIEAVPDLFVVALTMLLLAPLLPALGAALDMATHDKLGSYKTIIVLAASVSGLLSAWLSYPKPHHDKHK